MVIEIKGNLLETECRVIAHGVNCQNTMGSGVAKALFDKWPRVKTMYHDYFEEFDAGPDGVEFLGECDDVRVSNERKSKIVINCFTQQYFGYDGLQYLDYEALKTCMRRVLYSCAYYDVTEVAIPKIGCGLAGGDWNIVKKILEEVFPKEFKVKVYYLK